MEYKKVEAARIILKALAAVAAVFALIGSIGFLVSISRIANLAAMSSYSSSAEMQAVNAIMSLFRNYDFARVGALVLMGFAATLSTLDNVTGTRERGISTLTQVMAVFGFLAIFMTSISISYAVVQAGLENARQKRIASLYGNSYLDRYSTEEAIMSAAKPVQVLFIIAMILIMLSAIVMIISLIYSIYRLFAEKAAAANYAYQQQMLQQQQPYQQMPYAQYPQGYPQQQYPQQYQSNDNNTGNY